MPYTVTLTAIPDVLNTELKMFVDAHGGFFENFNHLAYKDCLERANGSGG
jgi:dTDP-4-dehydrorhamnose 3,5-epimerase-like enzyme